MRAFTATLISLFLFSVLPGSAWGGWTAPRSVSVARYWGAAVAVDGRGDAALAWVNKGADPNPATRYRSSIYVKVWTAGGRAVTRKLWSSNDARTDRLDITLGAGEVTVVWVTDNREGKTPVLRAAYGPLVGRWRAPRVIGRDPWEQGYPPTGLDNWFEHSAVAFDGEVLLAFNHGTGSRNLPPAGTTVVWRRPGHPFGVPHVLHDAPAGAVPRFDMSGTAYLTGYCDGFVLIAPAHTHRFKHRIVVTRGRVLDFNLSLSGAHRGFASWIDGRCSFDAEAADTPGPVFGSTLNAGAFAEPLQLSTPSTTAGFDNVVMTATGGTVNWETVTAYGTLSPDSATFSRQVDAEGAPGATQQTVSGPIALAADGGGDVLHGPQTPCFSPCAAGTFVRPMGGGADQPAPAGPGSIAVASPTGRAAAVVWQPTPLAAAAIELSVWRP